MAVSVVCSGNSIFTGFFKVESNPEQRFNELMKFCEILYNSLTENINRHVKQHIVIQSDNLEKAIESQTQGPYMEHASNIFDSLLEKGILNYLPGALENLNLKPNPKDLKEFIVPPNVFRNNSYVLVLPLNDPQKKDEVSIFVFPFHDKVTYTNENEKKFGGSDGYVVLSKDNYMLLDKVYNTDILTNSGVNFEKFYSYPDDSEFFKLVGVIKRLIKENVWKTLSEYYAGMYAIILYGFFEQYLARLHNPEKEFVYYDNASLLYVHIENQREQDGADEIRVFKGFSFYHKNQEYSYEFNIRDNRALLDYVFYHVIYSDSDSRGNIEQQIRSAQSTNLASAILEVINDLSPASSFMVAKLTETGIQDYLTGRYSNPIKDPSESTGNVVLEPIKRKVE